MLELVILGGGLVALLVASVLVAGRLRDAGRNRRILAALPRSRVEVFDRELRCTFAAGGALEQADDGPVRLVGRTLIDAQPPPEAQALEGHYRAALRGETRSLEHHSAATGRTYWMQVVPFAVSEGVVTEGLATSLDVTDRERPGQEHGDPDAEIEVVAATTQALARSTDPAPARVAVCEGARRLAGAPIAALFEPIAGRAGLRPTAGIGVDLDGFALSLADPDSGAARAFLRAEEVLATAQTGARKPDREFLDRTRATAVHWHPVRRDEAAIAVLAVAWRHAPAGVSPRTSRLIDLLGAAAAVAIDRAEFVARLEELSLTDELTGLPNRRYWQQELPRELARAGRDGRPLCIAILDLDHFKAYNDHHGHQAGDRLLQGAAGAWRATLRRYDTLARYGGEEFGIILPGCSLDQALSLVERLRSVTPEGESCSAGIAEWDRSEDPSTLLGRADAALYRAKHAGRNQTISAA